MATTKWTIDPTLSSIGFKAKLKMFTNVRGTFDKYNAIIISGEADFTNATIEFSADIDSINTHNSDRNTHLQSGDFFDAANHPKLTFKASSFTKTGADYEITKDLNMHVVPKLVKFPAEFSGLMTDPWGVIQKQV
jgi:polyisoprenoid-binding protein YceI